MSFIVFFVMLHKHGSGVCANILLRLTLTAASWLAEDAVLEQAGCVHSPPAFFLSAARMSAKSRPSSHTLSRPSAW